MPFLSYSSADNSFTPTCHSQVPGFVGLYDKFKAKGINDIYIVTVNDLFVVNAWKKDLDAGNIKFGEYKCLGRILT